jgi:hypothetical protein
MVTDGLHPRVQPSTTLEASYLPTPAPELYHGSAVDVTRRTARPVSWHPSSQNLPQQAQIQIQQLPQQQQATHYPFPKYNEADYYPSYTDMPPTPAAYSGYTSPASVSAFSPLSLPCSNQNLESQGFYTPSQWSLETRNVPALDSTSASSATSADPLFASSRLGATHSDASSLVWNAFGSQEYNHCSAPPTPENVLQPPPQPLAKFTAEESIPFQPLDVEDDESDGEILYGMGLYDAPEANELSDHQWRFHRSTVLSLLGGVASNSEAPKGTGLKLEDAWEPPASDDEDENEEDASGDEQEEDDDDDE